MHHGLAPVGGALNDYACGGSAAMSVWLARPEVVKVRANTASPADDTQATT